MDYSKVWLKLLGCRIRSLKPGQSQSRSGRLICSENAQYLGVSHCSRHRVVGRNIRIVSRCQFQTEISELVCADLIRFWGRHPSRGQMIDGSARKYGPIRQSKGSFFVLFKALQPIILHVIFPYLSLCSSLFKYPML